MNWNWATIPKEQIGPSIVRQMIHGQSLMICRLTLAAGTVSPRRTSMLHEQMTIIERGRVRFTLGSEERSSGLATSLLMPSGLWHGATMLDEEEVVLIDISRRSAKIS